MKALRHLPRVLLLLGLLTSPGWCANVSDEDAAAMLKQLSLEELTGLTVVSVSKTEQKLSNTPAAVFVITNEDIRRSGATNIPDALRMVPGLHVGVIDGNKWAITSRGFNGRFANKLLVLLDGRSVYSPLYSGVLWQQLDTILEDIDRIEVIRGPGATVWGANAVNGVINIITKKATDTQGGLVGVGAGNNPQHLTQARYGGMAGDNLAYRVSVKHQTTNDLAREDGADANDATNQAQAMFRIDATPTPDTDLALSGAILNSDLAQTLAVTQTLPHYDLDESPDMTGGYVQGSLRHGFDDGSSLEFILSLDRMTWEETILELGVNVLDARLEHHLARMGRHDPIWGLGFRWTGMDANANEHFGDISPDERSISLASAFVQDTITLLEDAVWLSLGTKVEHNDYTGFELQPGARLLWTPTPHQSVWASAARAVRTPSRIDSDMSAFGDAAEYNDVVPGFPILGRAKIRGNDNLDSETLDAFELGYRVQPTPKVSLDVCGFYNRYDKLHVYVFDPGYRVISSYPWPFNTIPHEIEVDLQIDNAMHAESYGLELTATTQMTDDWRMIWGYSWIDTSLHAEKPSNRTPALEETPSQQFSIRSLIDLPHDLEWDTMVVFQDAIEEMDIDPNVRLDMRLGWKAREDLEFSLVGQSLLEARNLEYTGTTTVQSSYVERSVFGKVTWRF